MTKVLKSEEEWVVWFSRILRCVLGGLIIWIGFRDQNNWTVMGFGFIMGVTGFFRPGRCINSS